MPITYTPLHQLFGASVEGVDLRRAEDAATLAELRAGMDRYGVLVFHGQPFTDEEQLAFARRFDGELHSKTGSAALGANRFGNEALSDISNLDENGDLLDSSDRRRMYSLGNRLWHTDASFQDPAGRYSLLSAREIPPVPADTQFVDTYSAYEALDEELRATCEGLEVHHSIAFSRQTLGFDFAPAEQARLAGAVHPLVRTNPETMRRSLYLASHANRILDWPLPEGRLLLLELLERATESSRIYTHRWRVDDLVIWDNRATMHRGVRYDDTRYRRELRRVTTLDLPRLPVREPEAVASAR